jgi:diguanylate cyclase
VVAYQEGSINADPLRLSLIAELRQALASNQLELHYQTQVDARTQMPSGVEALIRWNHPTRGRIAPDYFIPLAESTGLIGPLTRWVVETAVSQLASWGPALGELSVAINVSARNLSEVGIAEWIVERLQFHNVDPSRVVLEVTETSFTNDEAAASAHIATLNAAGIDVSLDDFGQGYTSLSHLANLRISELKIDRSFVTGMLEEPKKRAIVASVIELGHQLGFRVVAEGVETLAVYHELRDLRCDVMQGYLFSQPLSQSLLRASLLDYRIPAKRETVPAS